MSRNSSRRTFLASTLGALLGGCGWDGGDVLRPRLFSFSRVNDWVGGLLFSEERMAR